MRKLPLILLMTTSISSSVNVFSQDVVSVGVSEYAPLISKDFKYNGVVARIITEAFSSAGIKVEFKWVPWKRAYLGVIADEYDLSPTWSKSVERKKEVNFSDPMYESYQVFFHLKSNPFEWQSYNDLKGMKIGRTLGYFYGTEFHKAEVDGVIRVEVTPNDDLNFKKLVVGRFQLFPANILTGDEIAKKSLTPEEYLLVTHHPKSVSKPNFHYVVFGKTEKGNRLRQLFNKGLKNLKESKKFDKYFEESRRGEYHP